MEEKTNVQGASREALGDDMKTVEETIEEMGDLEKIEELVHGVKDAWEDHGNEMNQGEETNGTDAPVPIHPELMAPARKRKDLDGKPILMKLGERFIHYFAHLNPDGSPSIVYLTDAANVLQVRRRRLYDVVNILESIDVMARVGKLQYEFRGYDHIPRLLSRLVEEEGGGEDVGGKQKAKGEGNMSTPPQKVKSENSLYSVSRKLVRLMLVTDGPLLLSTAGTVLAGKSAQAESSGTKKRSQAQVTLERRLYDIGSILTCVGLIERIYIDTRQPAFQWVYGWKPGSEHDPPELAVAAMAREPAPPIPEVIGNNHIEKVENSPVSKRRKMKQNSHELEGERLPDLSGYVSYAQAGMMPSFGTVPANVAQSVDDMDFRAAGISGNFLKSLSALPVSLPLPVVGKEELKLENIVDPAILNAAINAGYIPSSADTSAQSDMWNQVMYLMLNHFPGSNQTAEGGVSLGGIDSNANQRILEDDTKQNDINDHN